MSANALEHWQHTQAASRCRWDTKAPHTHVHMNTGGACSKGEYRTHKAHTLIIQYPFWCRESVQLGIHLHADSITDFQSSKPGKRVKHRHIFSRCCQSSCQPPSTSLLPAAQSLWQNLCQSLLPSLLQKSTAVVVLHAAVGSLLPAAASHAVATATPWLHFAAITAAGKLKLRWCRYPAACWLPPVVC